MKKTIFFVISCLLLTSCILYRQDIQQGNVYSAQQVAMLKPGMTEEQVRYVMGTPVLQNTFEPNRWDYVYSFKRNHGKLEQKHVTLYFVNGHLHSIQTTP